VHAATNSSLEVNGNSPAAHITASENLTIPATVAVPGKFTGGTQRVAHFYAVWCSEIQSIE
jgi:hypothetical protein